MPHTLEHATQGSLTPQPDSALALPAVHELACFRTSPRPSLNQGLVDQLKPLREWRFLQHGSASTPSRAARRGLSADARSLFPLLVRPTANEPEAISYATAVSVIIGTPFVIDSAEQARALPKVRSPPLLRQLAPSSSQLTLSPAHADRPQARHQDPGVPRQRLHPGNTCVPLSLSSSSAPG